MDTITVEELKSRMDAGEKLHVLDVREPNEYEEFNIGAKLIPLGQVQAGQIDDIEDWKDEEVIVHCRSGKRSAMAASYLESFGFNNVKNLTGGMLDWQDKFGN